MNFLEQILQIFELSFYCFLKGHHEALLRALSTVRQFLKNLFLCQVFNLELYAIMQITNQ